MSRYCEKDVYAVIGDMYGAQADIIYATILLCGFQQ
jgi:hypothetical protein